MDVSKKQRKYPKERLVKGIKDFLKKRKIKSINMLMNNIGIFLRRKTKSVNKVANDIKIFLNMEK